jgi:hypothetical protein
MAPMRVARSVLLVCLLAAAALLAGCGGSQDSETTAGSGATAESRPAPPRSDFPEPQGRTLKELMQLGDRPAELQVEPSAMVFYEGENRYPFGVNRRDRDDTEVTDAEVAIYYSRVPPVQPGARSRSGNKGAVAKAEARALEQPAIGPFPARIESLAVDPEFRSPLEEGLPEPDRVVYSVDLDFPSAGSWRLAALVKEGEELNGTLLAGAEVGEFEQVPRPGQPAPRIEMSEDYAEALGREPIVLLFASPRFCQSRACRPALDATAQARRKYGDEAAFIHMELYNNNDPADGVRPQVRGFHLPSELWLFTIDRGGVVRAAIEGAFGSPLLDEAIEKALR